MSAGQLERQAGSEESHSEWLVSSCMCLQATLYVERAFDRETERAFELHYMGCARCLHLVERARAMNSSTDELVARRHRAIWISRAILAGETFAAAAKECGVSTERARQILHDTLRAARKLRRPRGSPKIKRQRRARTLVEQYRP
jgi:hypothetical protein